MEFRRNRQQGSHGLISGPPHSMIESAETTKARRVDENREGEGEWEGVEEGQEEVEGKQIVIRRSCTVRMSGTNSREEGHRPSERVKAWAKTPKGSSLMLEKGRLTGLPLNGVHICADIVEVPREAVVLYELDKHEGQHRNHLQPKSFRRPWRPTLLWRISFWTVTLAAGIFFVRGVKFSGKGLFPDIAEKTPLPEIHRLGEKPRPSSKEVLGKTLLRLLAPWALALCYPDDEVLSEGEWEGEEEGDDEGEEKQESGFDQHQEAESGIQMWERLKLDEEDASRDEEVPTSLENLDALQALGILEARNSLEREVDADLNTGVASEACNKSSEGRAFTKYESGIGKLKGDARDSWMRRSEGALSQKKSVIRWHGFVIEDADMQVELKNRNGSELSSVGNPRHVQSIQDRNVSEWAENQRVANEQRLRGMADKGKEMESRSSGRGAVVVAEMSSMGHDFVNGDRVMGMRPPKHVQNDDASSVCPSAVTCEENGTENSTLVDVESLKLSEDGATFLRLLLKGEDSSSSKSSCSLGPFSSMDLSSKSSSLTQSQSQ